MTISQIMEILQAAMLAAIKIAAPILITSIAVGLIIAIFQAATQIHEQTITFVPKLFAIVVVLLVMGSWMLQVLVDLVNYIFNIIVKLN
ncbi:MAG TPA: flagellar biosynthetic protein FliQ [Clostridiales bacterium]|nr:flagellar biosynthetic protein FliQ [Clostridiales bacterium]